MELLKDYPLVLEQKVAWGEMDALSHVNNVVYFRYFETARIEYFNRIKIFDLFDIRKVGPVLRDTSCQFRRPVTFPDTLAVGAKVEEINTYDFVMSYKIASESHQHITTQGMATVVLFDFKENKKVVIPEELVEMIRQVEQGHQVNN